MSNPAIIIAPKSYPPVNCRVCKLVIAAPAHKSQKVHSGSCVQLWKNERLRERRKQAAAKL